MGEPKESHDDEHIEELLSQLQGIFGKLSNAEEEESREKVDLPAKSEATAKSEPPAPPPAPSTEPPAPEPAPQPIVQAPAEPPPTAPAPPAQEVAPDSPPADIPAAAPSAEQPTLEISAITPEMLADKSFVLSVVCYPTNREDEVKILGQKLETMAPKFTKVAFQLKIAAFIPYNPKTDWQEAVLAKATEGPIRAFFILVDRSMDEARRKAMAAALESKGVYFQEVPVTSIEKKALYTDLLLGMVFFFDSLKQSGTDAGG